MPFEMFEDFFGKYLYFIPCGGKKTETDKAGG